MDQSSVYVGQGTTATIANSSSSSRTSDLHRQTSDRSQLSSSPSRRVSSDGAAAQRLDASLQEAVHTKPNANSSTTAERVNSPAKKLFTTPAGSLERRLAGVAINNEATFKAPVPRAGGGTGRAVTSAAAATPTVPNDRVTVRW